MWPPPHLSDADTPQFPSSDLSYGEYSCRYFPLQEPPSLLKFYRPSSAKHLYELYA